ncbi:MAG: FAD-binding protein [Gemmatimonadales bacterium]
MTAPTPFAELRDLGVTQWQPKHETFTQPLIGLYQLVNPALGTMDERYRHTTANVQRLLGEAVAAGVHLRAYGGTWSMSRCAATDGWLLDTSDLNLLFRLRPASIRADYAGDRSALWLAQGGCSIAGLHRRLIPQGQSLQACGASNGQSIAGAIATGTHGSAIRFGSMQEQVRALHLVVSPTESIWLEPADTPVTEVGFAEHLGARLVRDDELFSAALVGFGSLGFVQGVLLQTRPAFTLRAYRRRLPYDDAFKAAVTGFDLGALPVPVPDASRPADRLWHYSVVIDPFHPERGVFVTAMYDQPCGPGSVSTRSAGIAPGDELYGTLGRLLDLLPGVIPGAVSALVGGDQRDLTDACGTLEDQFPATETRGKAAGVGVSVAAEDAIRTLELIIGINTAHGPFPCILAFRFVPGTRATMGFTRFPMTCVVDIDGPYSTRTRSFFARIWQAMHDSGIPYGLHWGKIVGLSAAETRRLYGARVDRWVAARERLLPDRAVREVFRNEFLDELGLST